MITYNFLVLNISILNVFCNKKFIKYITFMADKFHSLKSNQNLKDEIYSAFRAFIFYKHSVFSLVLE
jgi:hypothetical protein